MSKGRHAEALPILEGVLATDQIHCQAMHDLALCQLACEAPEQAVAMLQRLMQRDYRWSYYRAWRTLIDAQLACKKPEEALKAARELAKMVPTLENKCLLAEHLLDNHLKSEAIDILDQALEDHAYTPMGKRLKNWTWARHAQRLLSEAERP
jgi:thioredoxin-like negative regulator of GroEL